MADPRDLDLYVATYVEPRFALGDFRSLEAGAHDGFPVIGAAVLIRHADGKVDLLAPPEAGDDRGEWVRGATGLVVGLLAPELVLVRAENREAATAVGQLIKQHDEGSGIELEEYFPAGASVVVVLVDRRYVHRLDGILLNADRCINQAIDPEAYRQVAGALAQPIPFPISGLISGRKDLPAESPPPWSTSQGHLHGWTEAGHPET